MGEVCWLVAETIRNYLYFYLILVLFPFTGQKRNVTDSSWIMLFFIVVSSHYCFSFLSLYYHFPFVSFLR